MKYWAVDGGLRKGEWIEGSVEISEKDYAYLSDNLEFFTITIVNGSVVTQVDMEAYRRAALVRLENTNFVEVNNRRYYDDELPYIGPEYYVRSGGPCLITQQQMIKLVTDRNRKYTLRRSGIQTARTPEEVDGYLTCQTI